MSELHYQHAQMLDDHVISHLAADKRRAYVLALVAMFYGIVVTILVALLFPLKSVVALPVVVDRNTGETTVMVGQTDELENPTIVGVLDRYFVTKYLQAREGFHPPSLQTDFDFVENATSSKLFPLYAANFDPARPDNYLKIYSNRVVDVAVKTISLISDPSGRASASSERTYSVSIDRLIRDPQGSVDRINYRVVMTTSFLQVSQEEAQTRINPLGFYVSTYSRNQTLDSL